MRIDKHQHIVPKICVSGAAETSHCGEGAMELAKEVGKEIARAGATIVTGATTGFPLWAAIGAKDGGAVSIGISPASSEREHVEIYRLPVDYMDFIIYTGFGYSGRDLILTRSCDAVIFGCGRVGTIHELTVAFEDKKPIGVLEGPWETDETIRMIIERGHRVHDKVVFEKDPRKLVETIMRFVKQNKAVNEMTFSYRVPE